MTTTISCPVCREYFDVSFEASRGSIYAIYAPELCPKCGTSFTDSDTDIIHNLVHDGYAADLTNHAQERTKDNDIMRKIWSNEK